MYPQYTQGDFLERTINQCAQRLSEARGRSEGWKEAIDDILGINSVPIMTIAKSKGLEFHTVIVLGLEDFAFHHPDGNPADINVTSLLDFHGQRRSASSSRLPSAVVATGKVGRRLGRITKRRRSGH